MPKTIWNAYPDDVGPASVFLHFPGGWKGRIRESVSTLRVSDRGRLPFLFQPVTGTGAEVGVQCGHFAAHLLAHYPGRVHLVDAWRHLPSGYTDIANVGDEQHEANYRETVARVAPFGDRAILHRALSVDAARNLPDESLDFVYLDANQAYEAVRDDLAAWWPKVRPGGLMAGHDYLDGERPEGIFGVKRAVDEFLAARGLLACATAESDWQSWYCFKPVRTS